MLYRLKVIARIRGSSNGRLERPGAAPDMAARTAHMAETKHCNCFECKAYVPPGMLYSHWSNEHANLIWNDHAVAWTDRENVRSTMPWVKEAREKAAGTTVVSGTKI
jgi:hypothetical protein